MRRTSVLIVSLAFTASMPGYAGDFYPEFGLGYASLRQEVRNEPLLDRGHVESVAARPGFLFSEQMGLNRLELAGKSVSGSHIGKAHQGYRGSEARISLNQEGQFANQQLAFLYRESHDDLGLIGATLAEQYNLRQLVGRARETERIHGFSHFMQWNMTPRWSLETALSAQSVDRVSFSKSGSAEMKIRYLAIKRLSVGMGAQGLSQRSDSAFTQSLGPQVFMGWERTEGEEMALTVGDSQVKGTEAEERTRLVAFAWKRKTEVFEGRALYERMLNAGTTGATPTEDEGGRLEAVYLLSHTHAFEAGARLAHTRDISAKVPEKRTQTVLDFAWIAQGGKVMFPSETKRQGELALRLQREDLRSRSQKGIRATRERFALESSWLF